MLHHISLAVADLGTASAFYDAIFLPLGYTRVWSFEDAVGYGPPGGGDKLALKKRPAPTIPSDGFHLAFSAPSEDAVAAFHAAALRHGGRDNGPPGLRPQYGPGYFAAFVIDPEGHRIEAIFRAPTGA